VSDESDPSRSSGVDHPAVGPADGATGGVIGLESSGVLDEEGLPKERPHGIGRRILSGVLSYGVVALALWYLFTSLHNSDQSAEAISRITGTQVAAFVALGVVNLATNWPPLAIALPGLRIREAAVTNTASAALSNTVPEGGAVATGLNVAMLRSWGFTLRDITSEILVTGTWSQLTKYVLLAVSGTIVVLEGSAPSGFGWWMALLAALVVAAVVILALILRSSAFAARLGAWVDRAVHRVLGWIHRDVTMHLADQVPEFRAEMVGLLRVRGGRLTAAMLVSQLTAGAILGIACRSQGLGVDTISWAMAYTAFGLATFASLLVPTPGGLGVAELVLVGVLSYGLPDSDTAAVIAAVLLYRLATFLVPIPIGLVTYLYWRTSTAWRRPVDSKPVTLTAA
jgi:putative heme transporter